LSLFFSLLSRVVFEWYNSGWSAYQTLVINFNWDQNINNININIEHW
jgi:hypothetical protein